MGTRALLTATFSTFTVDRLEILLEIGRIPVGAILGLFSLFPTWRLDSMCREVVVCLALHTRLPDTALK